jgi:hypothetical protein
MRACLSSLRGQCEMVGAYSEQKREHDEPVEGVQPSPLEERKDTL